MAGFRDFLMRFRPVGLPGPAAAGGVPADRSAELAAELEPPLVLLEETEAEARAVRERADEEATRRRRAAERTAKDIVEQARARAPVVREQSAALVRDATKAEATELLAAAARDTAVLRRRIELRTPALVDRLVDALDKELTAPDDERREGGPPPWAPAG
ncbi:hypothetical protein [Streptomyces mirabilis]|uniref:hypothetical protein n=2 Tax=Streptomyces mirabilis TaxID=68239 RepID=UPI0006BAC55C|nr:hypothetical protein [Streptomyces mirabilis]KPI11022.1 hypothetical protein OK006_4310 [Actinobacteria bacterium OK006]MCX4418707.1 hypothetical protein [Streptomyces mirabilis]